MTQEIVSALKVQLKPDEKARLGHGGTENVEAHDLLLQARERAQRFTAAASAEAQAMLERAVDLAPDFTAAHAELALGHARNYVNQWAEAPQQVLEDCAACAERRPFAATRWTRARTSPPESPTCGAKNSTKRRPRRSGPSNSLPARPRVTYSLATVTDYSGASRERDPAVRSGDAFQPHFPGVVLHFYGHAHLMMGRYEEAAAIFRQRIERERRTDASRALLAAALGHMGKIDEAREAWRDMLAINPKYSLEHRANVLPYKDPAQFERIREGLANAGLPN